MWLNSCSSSVICTAEHVRHAKDATGETGRCGSGPESWPLKDGRGQGDRGQLCSTQGRWVKNSSPASDGPPTTMSRAGKKKKKPKGQRSFLCQIYNSTVKNRSLEVFILKVCFRGAEPQSMCLHVLFVQHVWEIVCPYPEVTSCSASGASCRLLLFSPCSCSVNQSAQVCRHN